MPIGKRLLWIFGSIVIGAGLTCVLIRSGADWWWAVFCNVHDVLVMLSVPFVLLGMVVPLVIIGYWFWRMHKSGATASKKAFKAALFSFITTYVLMTVLKIFTNRVDMEPFEPIGAIDFSDQFRFGFMNSNHWWESFSEGWPSGHTMIAVGMAVALHHFLQSSLWRKINIIYPVLIALSVSTAFHWLSDVVAGGLIGCAVGYAFRHPQPTKNARHKKSGLAKATPLSSFL